MIDFHSHILPEIDDGSSSLEETKEMLFQEYSQGVREIMATPHYYAGEESPESFLQRREYSLKRVREMLAAEDWGPEMRIRAGAEVYYFPGMGEIPALSSLCIEETSILLLELPFEQWDSQVYRDVEMIIEKQNLTVILAHLSRYYDYQKKKEIWNELLKLPLCIQLNANGFSSWKRRRVAMKFLKNGYEVVLGSDCHDTVRRPPNLAGAREVIRKKYGEEMLERIDRSGRKVLG